MCAGLFLPPLHVSACMHQLGDVERMWSQSFALLIFFLFSHSAPAHAAASCDFFFLTVSCLWFRNVQ
jgi:hypothetical protein